MTVRWTLCKFNELLLLCYLVLNSWYWLNEWWRFQLDLLFPDSTSSAYDIYRDGRWPISDDYTRQDWTIALRTWSTATINYERDDDDTSLRWTFEFISGASLMDVLLFLISMMQWLMQWNDWFSGNHSLLRWAHLRCPFISKRQRFRYLLTGAAPTNRHRPVGTGHQVIHRSDWCLPRVSMSFRWDQSSSS